MAKTYKILVNDGKGTDIKPVSVEQGVGAKGDAVHITAKRGWRFELQDDLKGKGLGPDQVRFKRIGKNLGLIFDGSINPDVIIDDYYADNDDKEKDNGMPMIVGQAENGGIYEYVPQDPAASSMAGELREGNVPVIAALGGGPLAADFALAGLPLVAAAGGGFGGLLLGGAALVAAAAGRGGGGGDTPAVVTTVAAPTVAIETDANNDGFVNRVEASGQTKYTVKTTLPTTAVAGDTITVTDGTTISTHVLTATDIANKFVTDSFALPIEGATINVSAKMTTAAGASSANATDSAKLDTSAFIDPVKPDPFNPSDPTKSGLRVTIDSDVNNDGFLSNSDLSTAGLVKATIALTKDAAVGDVLTITATGNTTQAITLTAAHIAAQQVVITGLTQPSNGNTITVTASIQDAASNTSPTPAATDSATVDVAMPGVTILNDENNDGYINKVESDKTTGVSVKVEVPSSAVAGNTIKVSNGTTTINHILTQAEVDAKSFIETNAFAKPAEGATITVTAKLGNNTTGGTDSAKLDTSAFIDPVNPDPINPVDPTKSGLRVTIDSDVNNDGFLSNADLSTPNLVQATIALTKDAAVGDLMTVVITGNTTRTFFLSAAQIAAKQVVLTGLTAPADGTSIRVEASIQDVAGNSSPAAAFDTATVNTAMPGVMITTDTNNDGLINKAELNNATTIAVRIEVPKAALVGDTVTVTDGTTTISHILTQADVTNKVFTESFAKPAEGNTLNVTASFGGNTGADSAKIDTAASNTDVGLGVSITTDANNDTYVNTAEIGTAATFNSRTTFDKNKVVVGDQIVFTVKNGSNADVVETYVLTATDVANGFVDKAFAKPASNALQTVTVNFVDKAGNAATDAKPSDSATLDTSAPTNEDVDLGVLIITDSGPNMTPAVVGGDGVVNLAELNAQRDIANNSDTTNFITRATFTSSKAAVGHKIIFTATNGVTALDSQTITLTQADVTRGFVEVKFAKPAEGQIQTVTAMYADAAGNADTTNAPTDLARLDTSAPNDGAAPVVTITTDNGVGGVMSNNVLLGLDDGFVNDPEINGSSLYTVEAAFNKDKVAVGDKVQFTVGASVTTVDITQAIKDAGKASTTFTAPTANGASFNVKVVIKDAVNNASAEGQDTAVRNKLIAVNDTSEITAPTNATPTTLTNNVFTNDVDPQFTVTPSGGTPALDASKVSVNGIKLDGASAFSAIANSVAGQFGSLKINADGSYTYTLNNTAAQSLGAAETRVENFVYQVTDVAGNMSTAVLAITVKGINDAATITSAFESDKNVISLVSIATETPDFSDTPLSVADVDAGQAKFKGITTDLDSTTATTADAKITGMFGDLTLTQINATETSKGYNYKYKLNNVGLADQTFGRHDLITLQSEDGSAAVTLDFFIKPPGSGAIGTQEFHTSSTAGLKLTTATTNSKDTLVLDAQLSFDFTGTVASNDIKSIEVIDITGAAGQNNTIRLDLNSLTQADTVGGKHTLMINGDSNDHVTYVGLTTAPTPTDGTGAFSGYKVFAIDSTHDLLIQQAMVNSITFSQS